MVERYNAALADDILQPLLDIRELIARLLDGLRKRFSPPKKDEAVQDLPLSAPASLAPDASAVPTAQETSVPASTEAQTTRRRKADSQKVKKNAVS